MSPKYCLALVAPFFFACASQNEAQMKDQWNAQAERREAEPSAPTPQSKPSSESSQRKQADLQRPSLARYVAMAQETSPGLKAAFERWHGSIRRISRARRLPDPKLSFGYFVRPVETRVGPQRARIGVSQTFPWPTQLTAGADAASARARAQQSQFEALALEIRKRVVVAYYQLWLIRETKKIHAEHLDVLRSLSSNVLARLEVGAATLADQQQVDLSAARLEDMLAGMDEDETVAKAHLRAAIGNREIDSFSTSHGPPDARLPGEDEKALSSAVLAHPRLSAFEHLAASHEDSARAEEAAGLPSFSLGADWIITGEARAANVPDSGNDAVIVGGGISIPLWRGSYSDAADAARAEASAARADRIAAEDLALAELSVAYAQVRDAVRRVDLHRKTLVPQADSAYESVLGAYVTGQGTVAQTLLAQKDLLELRGNLKKARAEYAIAWARLERVTGRAVQTRSSEEVHDRK